MNASERKVLLESRREQFGEHADDVLLNMSDDGMVVYTVVDGKKVYGLPKGVRTPDSPTLHVDYYTGPSETQQQFHDDVDIKTILRKHGVGAGYVPHAVAIPMEFFKDNTVSPRDYTEAFNIVQEANEMFMELPADLRRAVHDDPRELLELSQSDAGRKTLVDLGFGKHDPSLIKQVSPTENPVPAVAPSETPKK